MSYERWHLGGDAFEMHLKYANYLYKVDVATQVMHTIGPPKTDAFLTPQGVLSSQRQVSSQFPP